MFDLPSDGRTDLGPSAPGRTDPSPTPPGRDAQSRPAEFQLKPEYLKRGRAARALLSGESPGAGADEQILFDLVAGELPIIAALEEAQAQLVVRVALASDSPKVMVMLARALKDVVTVANSLSRRVEGTLTAAAGLRAQRRFLSLHHSRLPR